MERESSLERSRAQLEVDWQRRCEDTERDVHAKQEQLISALTKQRDEVQLLPIKVYLFISCGLTLDIKWIKSELWKMVCLN